MNIKFVNLNQRKFNQGDIVYCLQSEFKNFSKFKILFIKENNGAPLYFCGRLGENKKIKYIETFFKDSLFTSKEVRKIKSTSSNKTCIIN